MKKLAKEEEKKKKEEEELKNRFNAVKYLAEALRAIVKGRDKGSSVSGSGPKEPDSPIQIEGDDEKKPVQAK